MQDVYFFFIIYRIDRIGKENNRWDIPVPGAHGKGEMLLISGKMAFHFAADIVE